MRKRKNIIYVKSDPQSRILLPPLIRQSLGSSGKLSVIPLQKREKNAFRPAHIQLLLSRLDVAKSDFKSPRRLRKHARSSVN